MRLILIWLLSFGLVSTSTNANSTAYLAFSDLVNGPVKGLGDGLGQGAIVTVWGYRLGDDPGNVVFEDSQGKKTSAAYIYYWKKADGKLPGGPANLYKSHRLYEVAFSMPTVQLGQGKIYLQTKDGAISNPLPFTAIEGRIFHVKSSGSNSNDGSFQSPWQFVNGDDWNVSAPGNAKLKAGDTVYVHGTVESIAVENVQHSRAAVFLRGLMGSKNAHIGLISYPNTVARVESPTWGIHPYRSSGILISKYSVYGGLLNEDSGQRIENLSKDASTTQISTSSDGRIIANFLSDLPKMCSNGMSGSISGTGESINNTTILGNEISSIGCKYTSHFHHTTYLTVRTQAGTPNIKAGIFAWNFLHDNQSKYGIHYYDQSNDSTKACDQLTGELHIHDNVIVNQRSVGISVYTASKQPCWTVETRIYKNILINTGLGPIAEIANGIQPYAFYLGGAIKGSFALFNNLIVDVGDDHAIGYEEPLVVRYKNPNLTSSVSLTNNIIQLKKSIELIREEENVSAKYNLTSINKSDNILSQFMDFNVEPSEKFRTINYPVVSVDKDLFVKFVSPMPELKNNENNLIDFDFYGLQISNSEQSIGPFKGN